MWFTADISMFSRITGLPGWIETSFTASTWGQKFLSWPYYYITTSSGKSVFYCLDGSTVPWGSHIICLSHLTFWACWRTRLYLQVNFVAAIDVYEDGEAGLLLCYNCESVDKSEHFKYCLIHHIFWNKNSHTASEVSRWIMKMPTSCSFVCIYLNN